MSTNNRERLLSAATEVFLEHGYDASIDMIISRAGVARQTFYNHFENKERLFADAMRNCVADMLVPLNGEPGELRESLQKFGEAYRQRVLGAQGICRLRMVTSQAQRFPELTRESFELGLGQMVGSLSAFLQRAMDAGMLRRDDAVFAAEMLLSMLAGVDRVRLLYGAARPEQGSEAQRVAQIVDGFLRMFALGK